MKRLLIMSLIMYGSSIANAADGMVTGDAALASSASSQLNHSNGFNQSTPYSTLPRESGGSNSRQVISGSCAASAGSSRTCSLADSSWFCSASGVRAMGEGEGGYVYQSGGNWYATTWRGGWNAAIWWNCFKNT